MDSIEFNNNKMCFEEFKCSHAAYEVYEFGELSVIGDEMVILTMCTRETVESPHVFSVLYIERCVCSRMKTFLYHLETKHFMFGQCIHINWDTGIVNGW